MARRIAGVVALAALLSVLMAATCAAGREFYVGGQAGWAPNPAEPYNTWAELNRFQVNDTLVFRYSKGADAVLVVSQGHYDACNATEPALRLDDGDSRFVFRKSGPYFFISPNAARCRAGERLIVVVLAVRDGGGSGSSDDGTPTSTPPPPKPSASPAPPPPKSTSPPPTPGAAPAPRALPAPPPRPASTSIPPSSKSSSPPPPAPHALPTAPPPHPVPGKNASSPSQSPGPVPAPVPAPGTNATSSPPPSPSSAVAFRGGFLACLMLIGGAAILV